MSPILTAGKHTAGKATHGLFLLKRNSRPWWFPPAGPRAAVPVSPGGVPRNRPNLGASQKTGFGGVGKGELLLWCDLNGRQGTRSSLHPPAPRSPAAPRPRPAGRGCSTTGPGRSCPPQGPEHRENGVSSPWLHVGPGGETFERLWRKRPRDTRVGRDTFRTPLQF